MSKDQTNTQTQTSSVDPQTQAYINAYRDRAAQSYQQAQQQARGPNPFLNNQNSNDAANAYRGLTGNLGLAGQPFGADSLTPFLNPYQQQVTGAVQSNFDRQRQQTLNAANANATGAHAFGGSRQAVLQAQGLNDVNQNETGTLSELNRQGFNTALGAYQNQQSLLANLGLAGAQGLAGIGGQQAAGTAGLEGQRQQAILQALGLGQGGFQPGSTTSTNTQTQSGSLLGTIGGLAGIAGGVLTGGAAPAAARVATQAFGGGSRGASGAYQPSFNQNFQFDPYQFQQNTQRGLLYNGGY